MEKTAEVSVRMKSGLAAVTGTGRVDVPYELVPSTGERRKDTSLRYILHLALGSGRQPSPHFPFSPSAMHLLLGSTFATIQSSLCVTQRFVGSTIIHWLEAQGGPVERNIIIEKSYL